MHAITLDDMAEAGALLEGHFRLSSGLHSSRYLQCAVYLAEPARAEVAGRQLAARLRTAGAQLVVSPALGGVIIGHEVARALAVPFAFTERTEGVMALRRGFRIEDGTRVLVVEDVVTTGGSTREVMDVVQRHGGVVVGVASMVDRSGTKHPFSPLPYTTLLTLEIPNFSPESCPLCAAGVPIVKPGSRPRA
ncbi:MAG: orotate phosphoribosyltransferase [Thermoanaerobaculaceae bacterium]|nr:orotate phosphoribosyltransferase [Thermoanaerobaculaceae bacterium]MDI9620777.1 orotate phosphoribosyltransferase [Acidobacteriota bacterium]NLH10837.1 orotate phosphoribosyltransferase [Holophagae bacterium]HPW56236.1 orotate phosphoribosyltransferase [Thermoanaerobaculaceae bacterium]